MFAFRENQNIGLLRSLIAARRILGGSNRPARGDARGGESRQDKLAPCRVTTRRHRRPELRADALDQCCTTVIGFRHDATERRDSAKKKAKTDLFVLSNARP